MSTIESYQFRSAPYWLGFVFAGQAFTVSHREVIPARGTSFIQISTNKDVITHITNRTIISSREQVGIKLIKSPNFVPGRKSLQAVNLDDRSRMSAATSFLIGSSQVYGGTVLEESFIPMYAFGQGGSPVESALFERILQASTHYILAITNEGDYPTQISFNLAFYESEN
jgi:hypothetical protein